MNKKTRSGFTLPEVLISTVLAVLIFFAVGALLSRSFSVWYNAMAQWKVAAASRVMRTRLLDGGFGRGTGLLSSTNITVWPEGGVRRIDYYPVVAGGDLFCFLDWNENNLPSLYNNGGDPQWAYGQSVKYYGGEVPDVNITNFTAVATNGHTVVMTYTLKLSAAGRTFEQPQTLRIVLPNL